MALSVELEDGRVVSVEAEYEPDYLVVRGQVYTQGIDRVYRCNGSTLVDDLN